MNIVKTYFFLKKSLDDPLSYFNNMLTPHEKGMIALSKYPNKQFEEMSKQQQEYLLALEKRRREEKEREIEMKKQYEKYITPLKIDLNKFESKCHLVLDKVREKQNKRKEIDYEKDIKKGMDKLYRSIEKTGDKQINKVALMTKRFVKVKERINTKMEKKFNKMKRIKGFKIRFNKFTNNTKKKMLKLEPKVDNNLEKIHYVTELLVPEEFTVNYEKRRLFDIKKAAQRRMKAEQLLMKIEDYDKMLEDGNQKKRNEKEEQMERDAHFSSLNSSKIYEKYKTIKVKNSPSIIMSPGQLLSPIRLNQQEQDELLNYEEEEEEEIPKKKKNTKKEVIVCKDKEQFKTPQRNYINSDSDI